MFDKKRFSIQILSIIGIAITVKLAFIYYVANYQQYALSSFCSINEFIDCDGAAKSTLSQFWGIPLAYWGLFFYLTVLFLTFVDKLKNIKLLGFLKVFKNPINYIGCIGLIAFAISMVLAGMSIFKINKLCILCLITYFIDLAIALTAVSCNIKQLGLSIKNTVLDFIDGAKTYPKTFIILLIMGTSFLCYSGITDNFVPHVKRYKNLMKYRNIKYNPYRVSGNELGDKDAKVVIELYSDFVCPICYVNNIMIHQAVKELSGIKIIHHNLPFDKECNKYIPVNMHPGACFMSRVAIAARNQGKYWNMSSLLYENQPKTLIRVAELANSLNMDPQELFKDMGSEATVKEIEKEIDRADELNIDATPTMYINGDKYVGVKPYYVLKEILIQHGATKR